MQNITVTLSACGTTATVTNTTTGQVAAINAGILAALQATANSPMPLAQVANGYAAQFGAPKSPAFVKANKALRSAVQALAQPLYSGSAGLGALASTAIPGTSRVLIQWGVAGTTRKMLTRNGGNGSNGQTGLPSAS